jgi:hypothetical protein
MRTTIRMDARLYTQARREAERRGETFTALVERSVRLALAQRPGTPRRRRVKLPVCSVGGGTLPGVDIDDSATLLDLLEGRR